MWWLTLKKWFKISAAWCRQHWRWVVLALGALLMYYFGRKASRIQLIQARLAIKSYEQEKRSIEQAHQKEIEDIKRAQETYNKTMAHISQQFANKTDSLNLKKEREIRIMVKNAKKDPDELDRILEEELGIKKL